MAHEETPIDPQDLAYEEAFAELEAIVEALESGDLALDEALGQFERGQALADRCAELLDRAELKLSQLVQDQEGGYVEEDFDPEES